MMKYGNGTHYAGDWMFGEEANINDKVFIN